MSTAAIVSEEIDRQAGLASIALREISGAAAGTSARQMLPRAVLAMLASYSVALYFSERVVHSGAFNMDLVQALHSRLLPLERMADDVLTTARQRGYYDDPDIAEPLRWLEACDEQVKDCMVALESMLDPQLDHLMSAAKEEYERGDTVPLDSIS